ncbi:Ig domain-containing protein [Fodinibius sp.]|uniref:Ig domain-containing protein n=1 Tax=Fodinibius sp. TaxID=1872440 RepID=UPI002ACD523D|nr:Ig domain-containing protein [Fodinibius sp.]MDZ7658495.1 Ig domain-containing protein [Fodinibius sp.]
MKKHTVNLAIPRNTRWVKGFRVPSTGIKNITGYKFMNNKLFTFFVGLLFCIAINVQAQPTLQKDFSYVLEIPSTITVGSSAAHVYVLSDSEGMAVFRTQQDTLQWLYSSTGMEQRGNTMTADIRFAYLWGDSRRLTVLEPTSVLGVYSSTLLPANPRDAKRIGNNLYVALGDKGLGKLSLRTPAAVDSTMDYVERSRLSRENIVDLEASNDQLFALSSSQKLYHFDYEDEQLTLAKELELSEDISKIFLIDNTVYGSGPNGTIYELDSSGNTSQLGSIDEPVVKIESWKNWLIIQGSSNRVWTSYQNRSPDLWKEDKDAGNNFTVTNGDLWVSEYDKLSRTITSVPGGSDDDVSTELSKTYSGEIALKDISDQVVPHTKSLLFPIRFEQNIPANAVQISYQSDNITHAEIRGQSFFWQPTADDVGNHRIKIIASTNSGKTDSSSINIEVTSFNSPPRFAPIRTISIPINEEFSLPIKATDPDGSDKELIRYLGVDLPEGASIDEKTGEFTWTPTPRQIGKNEFRVIATDQYGAAKSIDITINVIENPRNE